MGYGKTLQEEMALVEAVACGNILKAPGKKFPFRHFNVIACC